MEYAASSRPLPARIFRSSASISARVRGGQSDANPVRSKRRCSLRGLGRLAIMANGVREGDRELSILRHRRSQRGVVGVTELRVVRATMSALGSKSLAPRFNKTVPCHTPPPSPSPRRLRRRPQPESARAARPRGMALHDWPSPPTFQRCRQPRCCPAPRHATTSSPPLRTAAPGSSPQQSARARPWRESWRGWWGSSRRTHVPCSCSPSPARLALVRRPTSTLPRGAAGCATAPVPRRGQPCARRRRVDSTRPSRPTPSTSCTRDLERRCSPRQHFFAGST